MSQQNKLAPITHGQYKTKSDFIARLGVAIGKPDLDNLLSQNEIDNLYELSKHIVDNISYDMRVKNLNYKVIVALDNLSIFLANSNNIKFNGGKNILDYCYLVLTDEVLDTVIENESNVEVLMEAIQYIKNHYSS